MRNQSTPVQLSTLSTKYTSNKFCIPIAAPFMPCLRLKEPTVDICLHEKALLEAIPLV